MRPWLRYSLLVLGAMLLLIAASAAWLLRSVDDERLKRIAADWMLAQHGRTLVFDGPLTLQLWPQLALAVQDVRLSEPGRPDERFASIAEATLSLHLEPLLRRREIDIDRISARGVKMQLRRDAEGRSNIDDLLASAAGAGTGPARTFVVDSVELSDAELRLSDALGGRQGRLDVQRLTLGRFGPGLATPLHLQAEAEFTEPALQAGLVLDATLDLLPAAAGPPAVRLDRTSLRLKGSGYDFEGLQATMQAASVRLEYGAGVPDSRADFDDLQLQFSGSRLGWQVDAGRLGLARLRLDVGRRQLELEQLELKLEGRRGDTTLAAHFAWPSLRVQGDEMQGAALSGQLQLDGDRHLELKLHSQPPSGRFERIHLPQLQLQIDGRFGARQLRGTGQGELLLAPAPLAASVEGMTLDMQLDDPALPRLQLALGGEVRWSEGTAGAQLRGSINGQRVEAGIDAQLRPPRPRFDVDASFATLDLNRFVAPARTRPAATGLDLQPLRRADGRLRLRVARLLRAPYRVDALDLRARLTNGALDLQRVTGRAFGGRFDASGSADAGSGRLALRLRADGIDMRALLADTTGYDGLRGRARIDADLRSRGGTARALRGALAGRIGLTMQPAALRGVDLTRTLSAWRTLSETGSDRVASSASRQTSFSKLDASFELRDGVARSDDLAGDSEFLRVSGEGTVDLAQGRLDYLLRTRVVNTASGRAGPEMVFLNGVTVPVQLNGPFGGIQWQVNWASVTAGVAARSVPNAVLGTVGGVARGVGGVARGAAGVLRGSQREPAAPR